MADEFVGILLAGGESRRFGSPKAFAERAGVPFYQYSIDVLTPFCSSIQLVTRPEFNDRFQLGEQPVQVLNDVEAYRGEGPLAGIYTGMEAAEAEWYIVLPTDVPFMEPWVFEELMKERESPTQALVPVVSRRQQPLIAIYHHSIQEKVAEQMSKGERSLHKLFQRLNVKYVEFDTEDPFRNINRREDFI